MRHRARAPSISLTTRPYAYGLALLVGLAADAGVRLQTYARRSVGNHRRSDDARTQTAATLVLVCHGEQPMIEADATTTGPATPLYFFVDGSQVDTSTTGTGSFAHPVINGAAYNSALTTLMDGPIIDIAGIADCPPTTIPVVTIPEPVVTIPAGQPQATVPPAPANTTSLPSAALPPSPPSAATTLPVTGTSSTAIAGIAAGFVGLGLMFRRAAKRPLVR